MRERTHRRLKKFAVMLLSFIMAFTMMVPSVFAAGNPWQGTASNDILISDTVTKLSDNVYEHKVITNNKEGTNQNIDYMCEVGKSDTIKVVASYGQHDASSWSLTPTTKQAAAYEKKHKGETVVAGINADFFNMANGQPMGALVMDGKVYNQANGRPYFGITKDGNAVIRQDNNLDDLTSAVGGDVILVNNGEPIKNIGDYGSIKYSRTAIGIKADGTIITMVCRGRNAPVSCGRDYKEMAEMFAAEGCVSALALDGGGSSTYAGRPEGSDQLVVRSDPDDGAERAVSSSILVVSTAEPTGIFDRAQLTPNNEIYTPNSKVQFEAKGVDTAGAAMELPEGVEFALAEDSKALGSIDPVTGAFTASDKTGVVTVNMVYNDKVIGKTTIEIVVPDQIYFASEEVSLGFEAESDLGVVVRNKGRDINYKVGDLKWNVSDERMGKFEGNTFITSDGESLTGTVTATSAYDDKVSGEIKVIVGKLPTVVWDFEDELDESGQVVQTAEEKYIGTAEKPGLLSTSNYGRGGKQSIEIASGNDDEPVRLGSNSLKLNYDFIDCGAVTEGACIGTSAAMEIPGTPTAIGVWVYAPEGVGVEYQGEGSTSGFWLRGYVKDGSGTQVPYDFTLEPKHPDVDFGKGPKEPGIYWEGWKYVEADLTKIAPPYSIAQGMTFRLMYVDGTKMGTKTANSIYFDNFQFVYGTNVDDTENPVISSITLNGAKLENGAKIDKDTVSIDAMLADVENKYTSGIDDGTVRMDIDGINVVDNKKYQYVYDASGDMAHLYDVKLTDGVHSVTVSAKDKAGNEVRETRYFNVDTGSTAENTTVSVVPATETAILGGNMNLQIKASDATVTDSKTIFKLGSQFKDYEVTYSENYEGKTTYSNLNKTITVDAKRKEGAAADDGNVIATVSVKVPASLKESDKFTYAIRGGSFETADGFYSTYFTNEVKLPISAGYKISAEPVIVGGPDAEIKVTDAEGNPAAGIGIYLVEGDALVGKTDDKGVLKTNRFNSAAGDHMIYAKDDKETPSFQFKLSVFDAQGDADGLPHNVRFNTVEDETTQKNITWFSSTKSTDKQLLKYAVSGSGDWTTVEAETKQIEFNTNGNNAIKVNAVNLDGLAPGTTYDYIVGTENKALDKETFTTAVAKDTNEFFIIGDIQDPDKSRVKTAVEQIDPKNKNYDFGIQIGDAIDQAADYQDWSDLGEILGAKMLGGTNMINVMGNHEYYGDPTAAIASEIYNNSNTGEGGCYSVEYGDIYVAVINFSNTATPLNEAAQWLVEDAKKSKATWKILTMHQPPYYTNNAGNEPVYQAIPDAAEEAGIDAVFSGHDHTYAVTNSLTDDQIDEKNGVVYYLVGAAGSKRYAPVTQDRFDYNTIFRKQPSQDYTATYLTVSSNEDEMTINLHDINAGLLDTLVLSSECKKNGHDVVFDPQTNIAKCEVCDKVMEEYTGEAVDKDGKEYYLIGGKKQTGWQTVGEEYRYYDANGVREKVTVKEEVKSTCIIDGYIIYISESGATEKRNYTDAGGHEYEDVDGKTICSKCGWQRFEMTECDVTLSYDACTWTGAARTPATKAVDPNGNVLTKPPTPFPDYASKYKNNVDVGTATVTLNAAKYGFYVDMNSWRGNYKGSVTVKYEIRPDAPKNAKMTAEGENDILTWEAAKMVDEYVIYQSENGGEWQEIATTKDTRYSLGNLDEDRDYAFRVGSRKTAKDGKTYESLTYTTAKTLSIAVDAEIRDSDGKPTLKWNKTPGASYTVLRSTNKDNGYEEVFKTTGTSYTHVSAKPGIKYFYKVKAMMNGKTIVSDIVSMECSIGTPVIEKTANSQNGKPQLAWKAVDGAVKYEVYRADTSDGEYAKMFTTTATTYTNTSAKAGYTYFYKVVAVTASGTNSGFSDTVSVVCKIQAPVVAQTSVSQEGKPHIVWDTVDGAAEYEVYRSDKEDGEYTKMFTTNGTSYTNSSAEVDKIYYYKVKAVAPTGVASEFSNIVSGKCNILAPVIEKVTNSDFGKPQLAWNAVDGAVKYEIYRADYSNGTYKKMFTTAGTTYTNTSAKAGYKYYYKVKAITAAGEESSFSDVIGQRCILAKMTIEKTGNSKTGKPQLQWKAVKGAAKYEVYRADYSKGTYKKMFTTEKTTYTNTSAKAGYTYYYKVKATTASGVETVFSDVVGKKCILGTPVISKVENSKTGKPMLTWEAVDNAEKYEVYRADYRDGTYKKMFTTEKTTYTNTSAKTGYIYYYKVKAIHENEAKKADSAYSEIVWQRCK